MKKLLLSLSIIFLSIASFAQTSNDLQDIHITNHPSKGLQRRADLTTFCWNAEDSFIVQTYHVYELDMNGDRDVYSKYDVSLYASNAWLVNPSNGQLLMTKEEYDATPVNLRPPAIMGEYTFFLLYAQNDIKLYQLLLSKVSEADQQRHKFDR